MSRLSSAISIFCLIVGFNCFAGTSNEAKKFDEFEGMSKIYHGLACTECLIRFYRSRMEGEIIAERFFRGCGSVPCESDPRGSCPHSTKKLPPG